MQEYQIAVLKALRDNYIWLIHNGKDAIVIDPTQDKVVLDYLHEHNLQLLAILVTHDHADHIGGIAGLVNRYHPVVYDNFTAQLHDNQLIQIVGFPDFRVLLTPGHTLNHVCYLLDEKHLFCGDTLFGMGCGRVFSGDFVAMYDSLTKIKRLLPTILCYPAHEYTTNNLRFTCSLDDDRGYYQELANYLLMKLSSSGSSLPSLLETELKYNLFLRCHDPKVWQKVAAKANVVIENELDCFIKLRELRNVF